MTDVGKARRRFSWSMRLILAGLAVELVSLFGLNHPLGFMLFVAVGCSLMALGIMIFLSSVLSLNRAPGAKPDTSTAP
ncbi:MAG: hypothetical protein ACRD1X_10880 [Vicinamibacteria bacterium]